MNFIKKHRVEIISIICIIVMLLSVGLWNNIVEKQKAKKETNTDTTNIDVSDASNIKSVEAKLGSDMKITQGYLLKYTSNKSGIWYMCTGYVKNITKKNKEATITLSDSKDSSLKIKATISTEKCDVNKGDVVNIVGTINFLDSSLELTKISKEDIEYKDVTNIALDELITNIDLIKSNYFIVSGYMVTDGDKYKLFDTKEDYKLDSSVGTYFTLSWKDKFDYTGNQAVSVKCKLEDTYKLNECELMTK